jgi:hypothetical protein
MIECPGDDKACMHLDAHRAVATKNCRVNFTGWQTVKVTERRIPLEQQYGYERGLSRAVSSDARVRA